jgi:hypothetical protein
MNWLPGERERDTVPSLRTTNAHPESLFPDPPYHAVIDLRITAIPLLQTLALQQLCICASNLGVIPTGTSQHPDNKTTVTPWFFVFWIILMCPLHLCLCFRHWTHHCCRLKDSWATLYVGIHMVSTLALWPLSLYWHIKCQRYHHCELPSTLDPGIRVTPQMPAL